MKRRTALAGITLSAAALAARPTRSNAQTPGAPSPVVAVPAQSDVLQLPNGARLVTVDVPDATVTAVDIFFTVGLVDEKRYAGINALIARTWGSDTENRSPILLQTDISRVGAVGTDVADDWVELWGIAGNGEEELRRLLQAMLTNIVANSVFPADVVAKGKLDQRAAMALAQDDLVADSLDHLRGRVFARSVYGLSVYGSETGLSALTPEAVKAYYDQYFRPERCVVSVAGPLPQETVRRLVEACMNAGGWSDRPAAPRQSAIPAESIPVNLRDYVVPRSAPAAVVAVGCTAPGTAAQDSSSTHAALLVLDAVMSGGKASRLFTALRDGADAIGYDVRSQVMARRGQSLWVVFATGTENPLACRDALLRECAALASGQRPITEDELRRARIYLKARHVRERQRPRMQAFGAGWAEAMGLGAKFDTSFDVRVDTVTLKVVNTFATKMLNEPFATVYTPLPRA